MTGAITRPLIPGPANRSLEADRPSPLTSGIAHGIAPASAGERSPDATAIGTMSDRRTKGRRGSTRENQLLPLVALWIAAVLALVVPLGYAWRSPAGFLLLLVGWAVVTSPLMVKTARWLRDVQED